MLKRLLDIIIASTALILLAPLYAFVAYKVKKNLGSPVLFRQVRPGLYGKPFEMIKFRTMKDAIDAKGQPLPDSERLTAFGKMLRSTSLDEMPELWNVIKGDMSIVGPRPLLERYLPYYTDTEKLRHTVRPGLSGLAQINGRNNLGWDSRLGLDVEYVQDITFFLDLNIILKTFFKAIKREGITIVDQATLKDLHVERSENDGDKNLTT